MSETHTHCNPVHFGMISLVVVAVQGLLCESKGSAYGWLKLVVEGVGSEYLVDMIHGWDHSGQVGRWAQEKEGCIFENLCASDDGKRVHWIEKGTVDIEDGGGCVRGETKNKYIRDVNQRRITHGQQWVGVEHAQSRMCGTKVIDSSTGKRNSRTCGISVGATCWTRNIPSTHHTTALQSSIHPLTTRTPSTPSSCHCKLYRLPSCICTRKPTCQTMNSTM